MHNEHKMALVAVLVICAIGLSSLVYASNYPLIVGEHQVSKMSEADETELQAATRWRAVDLSPAMFTSDGLVEGDTLTLDLFFDAVYVALVDRVTTNINGTVTVRGRIEGYPLAYVLISTMGNRSLAEIEVPEKHERFFIQGGSSGIQYLTDVSAVVLDKLEDGPAPVPPAETELSNGIAESATKSGPLDPATIDVMVVYTPQARQWANDNGGGIANVIAQAIEKGQLAHDNSNTKVTLKLVCSAETPYTESGSVSTDLDRLTSTSDGYMDAVHSWRNYYGADLVTLLTKVEDTGGLGWELNTTAGKPEHAFNVCRVQQSGWTYTVAHEQGHNIGCGHHKAQIGDPGPGLFSYSAGWRWFGNNGELYSSVMTYENGSSFPDGQDATQVGYWSNPSIAYQGVATGQATNGDNARTIRETKHVIAAYRTPPNCAPPSISTHPISQTKSVGQSVTFAVVASGTAPLVYQWQVSTNGGSTYGNVTTGDGGATATYTIAVVTSKDNGKKYRCVVFGECSPSATSAAATLTVNAAPTVVSATPASGIVAVGVWKTLTCVYSDPNGATDLATCNLLINTSVSNVAGAQFFYSRSANKFYMKNNSSSVIGGVVRGTVKTIESENAILDCAATSVTTSGNTLAIAWRFKVKSTMAAKSCNLFMLSADSVGSTSGWIDKGDMIVNASPSVVSVTPASVIVAVGVWKTLTCTYSDVNGATDLATCDLLVNTSVSNAGGAHFMYDRIANKLYMRNNAGTQIGGVVRGTAKTIESDNAILDCGATTVKTIGNTLTVAWRFKVKSTMVGKSYNLYLTAEDNLGSTSGWIDKGDLIVNVSPTVISATPASGIVAVGEWKTLTCTYSDANGATDLATCNLLINNSVSNAGGAHFMYNRIANKLYMRNNAGTQIGGVARGTPASIASENAVLDCGFTTVTTNGKNLTIAWRFKVKSALVGKSSNLYMTAADSLGSTSGWIDKGDLTGAP